MASKVILTLGRKLALIETNLVLAKQSQLETIDRSKLDGFFLKYGWDGDNTFDREINAIDCILWNIENQFNPINHGFIMSNGENIDDINLILDSIWPNETKPKRLALIFDVAHYDFNLLIERLIEASGYERWWSQRFLRSIITIQRRFKERVYAPGGSLAQKTQDQWNRRVDRSLSC
jgi:hypothetical protein